MLLTVEGLFSPRDYVLMYHVLNYGEKRETVAPLKENKGSKIIS
jgi:hypothetical protein